MSILRILLGAFLTVVTAWSLGRSLLRSAGARLYQIEEDLIAFLAGSACLSLIVFALSSLHLAGRSAFAIVCVVSVGLPLWRGWFQPARERLPRMPRVWLWLFILPFAVYTLVYFFNALAPQINPGNTGDHLGNVLRWFADRGFSRVDGSTFSNLPQGIEMLFLFAFAFGQHSAAILVHLAFLVTLPWLMLCYGRRFGMVRPMVLGAMLVYLSPAVGLLGTSAANDVALASVLFGLFYLLELWDASGDNRLLGLAGLLAGFGYAISYVAALGVVASVGFVGWRLLHRRMPLKRAALVFLATAAISISPWMVKNWLCAGNPFSPFLNSCFPNSNVHISAERNYAVHLGFSSVGSSRELPLRWSLRGTATQGVFGPWLLLTPLALLAVRWKHGRRLLAAALLFGGAALAGKAFALVLPFAVFAGPALGLAVQDSPGILPLLLLLHSFASWPQVTARYADAHAWVMTSVPIASSLRSIPEDQYLAKNLDGYAAARAVEQVVPPEAKVLTLCPVPQAYTTRRLWNYSESAVGELALQTIQAAYQVVMQPLEETRFRFSKQTIRGVRVIASNSSNRLWSVIEMRLYHGESEIPRRPTWRVSAMPNAADAPRAFDNSEVTAWSTWQAVRPGMYVEEDLDSAIPIDQVMVLGPGGEAMKLQVEGLDADGQWRTLPSQVATSVHLPPPGLRRAAAGELKSLGFEYIVAGYDGGPGRDMFRYASYWGLTCLQKTGNVCVFRLD